MNNEKAEVSIWHNHDGDWKTVAEFFCIFWKEFDQIYGDNTFLVKPRQMVGAQVKHWQMTGTKFWVKSSTWTRSIYQLIWQLRWVENADDESLNSLHLGQRKTPCDIWFTTEEQMLLPLWDETNHHLFNLLIHMKIILDSDFRLSFSAIFLPWIVDFRFVFRC
jgi:hypothetical protein